MGPTHIYNRGFEFKIISPSSTRTVDWVSNFDPISRITHRTGKILQQRLADALLKTDTRRLNAIYILAGLINPGRAVILSALARTHAP